MIADEDGYILALHVNAYEHVASASGGRSVVLPLDFLKSTQIFKQKKTKKNR